MGGEAPVTAGSARSAARRSASSGSSRRAGDAVDRRRRRRPPAAPARCASRASSSASICSREQGGGELRDAQLHRRVALPVHPDAGGEVGEGREVEGVDATGSPRRSGLASTISSQRPAVAQAADEVHAQHVVEEPDAGAQADGSRPPVVRAPHRASAGSPALAHARPPQRAQQPAAHPALPERGGAAVLERGVAVPAVGAEVVARHRPAAAEEEERLAGSSPTAAPARRPAAARPRAASSGPPSPAPAAA